MIGVWRRRLNARFDEEEKLDKGGSKGEAKIIARMKLVLPVGPANVNHTLSCRY